MTVSKFGMVKGAFAGAAATALTFVGAAGGAHAADWSTTELHYQYGKLDNPFARTENTTNILTFQYAGGYSFGDVFFFVDFLDDDKADAFNDKDAYAELWTYWSASKILGLKFGGGLIKDAGVVGGINYGADANFTAYLPGAYLDWNVPGFAFLRTQVTGFLIEGDNPDRNSFEFDVSWAYPFQISGQYFSIEGHVQYQGEHGAARQSVLGQPQFRWDVGYALSGKKDKFFIGTEYQFWINELGTSSDESAFQALGVWRF